VWVASIKASGRHRALEHRGLLTGRRCGIQEGRHTIEDDDMTRTPAFCGSAASFVIALAQAQAAPLMYHESIDGDLTGTTGESLPVLPLDVGTNTISGTLGTFGTIGSQDQTDFDSFAFSVPAGNRLVTVAIAFTDSFGNTANFGDAEYEVYLGALLRRDNDSFLERLSVSSPGTYLLKSVPIEAGVYNFNNFSYGGSFPGPEPPVPLRSQADYIFSLTVSPVSNPGSSPLALAGLALVGLAVSRKRRV
jgi:MYXO-CTERM domain-containing protein